MSAARGREGWTRGDGQADPIRIATRSSELALWQARWVAARLQGLGHATELVEVLSDGDRSSAPIAELGVGVFVKAVQRAVLDGSADLAVHSFKDLPSRADDGLELAAVPLRASVHDVLLVHPRAYQADGDGFPLRLGAQVGTSAPRRAAQLQAMRPDLRPTALRGNVPSRVQQLQGGAMDAVVLAAAGLERLALDLTGLQRFDLAPTAFVPAPAQGALALEIRRGDPIGALMTDLHDVDLHPAVAAERGLMAMLDAGCQLALGAHAWREAEGWVMVVWYQDRQLTVRHAAAEALPGLAFEAIGRPVGRS